MNTIRVGAEVKVTPQFAVRAGVAYSDSPIKDKLKNGEKEVFTLVRFLIIRSIKGS